MAGPEACQRRPACGLKPGKAIAACAFGGLGRRPAPRNRHAYSMVRSRSQSLSPRRGNVDREGPKTELLAFHGFHHFDRLFALPRPRYWASVAAAPISSTPTAKRL